MDINPLSVAPMMAWTDRHCRYLHRLYSPNALLFTEMVTTGALTHGKQWWQLNHNVAEYPLALQLGGNHPGDLAFCCAEAAKRGFCEINLNVGCPSNRVQKGTFGACLMQQPKLVAQCIKAMLDAVDPKVAISVKCRLGVDDYDSDELLADFVGTVAETGCDRFYIHARKALLNGLTPAQNRSIPPLQPLRVKKLKAQFPHLSIIYNGGIETLEQVQEYLTFADGVMVGRSAYNNPMLLSKIDHDLNNGGLPSIWSIMSAYREYMVQELAQGAQLHHMTKHLLHSFTGVPHAKHFRRKLSDQKALKLNDIRLFDEALNLVAQHAA